MRLAIDTDIQADNDIMLEQVINEAYGAHEITIQQIMVTDIYAL
jgi:hypothetical protein